jgi:hypothetical protein
MNPGRTARLSPESAPTGTFWARERQCSSEQATQSKPLTVPTMHMILPLAAAGYSLVYLLAGGGVGGAIVIFIIAKLLGK